MKRIHMNQRGVAHIMLTLGLVVLVVIGFAGYRVLHKPTSAAAPTTTARIVIPAKIQSKADAQKAAQALANDQISSQLNPDQLNADVNNLL